MCGVLLRKTPLQFAKQIASHPPKNIEAELFNSSFDTESPLILTFEEADRGKQLYLTGRWEIEREGIKGEFGDIVTVFVP
jgi:hypothetical protein